MRTAIPHNKTTDSRPLPVGRADDRFEFFRAAFLESGLRYGQSYGSKGDYARNHPVRLFVSNACVFTRNRECVWRGDLDLAARGDRRALLRASARLNVSVAPSASLTR